MAKAIKKPKANAPLSSWQKYDQKKTERDKTDKAKAAIMKKHSK